MKILNRAGKHISQTAGFSAFIPEPLPPNPSLKMEGELSLLLSQADQAVARLDGVASILPNPNLFVFMYVRKEAVLSSQIEGTQSSLDDLLEYESKITLKDIPYDVGEVSNYVKAMNYGLERLQSFPLSLRLIREIHEKLMDNVRGSNKTPGEFRCSQNWIGPKNCSLEDATFVPPPVTEMKGSLGQFEKFLHKPGPIPVLIQCGLAHCQFETIHPFLDGNGRIGRLLITFLLCQKEILQSPLLYLSHYFKKHKQEYYDRLMIVRNEGDWEQWIEFFLKGVIEVSKQAQETAQSIIKFEKEHREIVSQKFGSSPSTMNLWNRLFEHPIIQSQIAQSLLGCSQATAIKCLNQFVGLKILEEITGSQRYRVYRFSPYLDLFRS